MLVVTATRELARLGHFWDVFSQVPAMATIEKRPCRRGESQYRVKIRMRGHPAANVRHQRAALLRGLSPIV